MTEEDQVIEETEKNTEIDEALEAISAEYEAKLAAERDRMLRTIAEYENAKKRTEREKEGFLKYAIESFVKDLIPILDSIDRALSSTQTSKDFNALSEGVELIQKQITTTLEKRGVSRISAIGKTFDPNLHEAIAQVDSDQIENTIVHEFQTGYTLNDRLIRASTVTVSKGSPPLEVEENTEEISESEEDKSDE